MEHETDYQRARRQRSEHKKFGITGSTPSEATKNIKEHTEAKKKAVAKKMSWAESHGQKEGHQLKGTITGKKFGPKSY